MAVTTRRQYGPSRHWIYVLVLSFAAAACGSGSGSSSGGTGGTGGTDGTGGAGGTDGTGDTGGDDGNRGGGNGGSMLEANFASIQENVFTPICTNCHIGASAPLGLRLDEANSYALLVGVQSAQVPVLQRVEPNNPDESYLIRKLEGSASVGERMPLGMTPLPQADIDVIRQWITDGAQPDTPSEPPSEPVRVTSLSPLPDTAEMRLPSSVVAVFDRELDANTLDETTFLVERSGGDGTFGDDNDVALDGAGAVSVPQANPSTAVFDLSGRSSVADTYRVTLVGSEGAAVLDLAGNALDGEFDGSFPSGDGAEGGDFVAQFEVEGIQPTLESIQANVFTPICTACHNGQADELPGSMDLTSVSTSFMNLVEVPSVQDDSLERVTPGDPDASYLIRKIEGTADTGERMPPFTDPLDDATIAAMREWIGDGAAL